MNFLEQIHLPLCKTFVFLVPFVINPLFYRKGRKEHEEYARKRTFNLYPFFPIAVSDFF